MNRGLFKIKYVIGCLSFLFVVNSCQYKEQTPNVVLFIVDDLGWKDVALYGSNFYQTPNVDFLASEGIRFTDAYASCTVCSPTRASIMTGKYPAHLNCTDWIEGYNKPYAMYSSPNWTQRLRATDTTLAEVLKQAGYKTIHIGKWHLGEAETDWPTHHGFDINVAGWRKGSPSRKKGKGGYFVPYNNPKLEDGPEGEYLTERLAKEASNFIKSNKDEPFFLNFWLYNVHTPLQAKQEKNEKYKNLIGIDSLQTNATYAAMVEHMDEALGKLISTLKETGVYENTIIIFSSDNGGLIGNKSDVSKKPRVTSNYPLRTGKGDIYEGGVRVPLIISWPNTIKKSKTTDVLAISNDIFPTLAGLLDIDTSIDFDGENLENFIKKNQKPDRDALYWHYPHYHTEGATPYSAIRKGEWKLIYRYEKDSLELYNLREDIGETNNLALREKDKTNELLLLLNQWKKEMKAQDPIENPNFDVEKQGLWK